MAVTPSKDYRRREREQKKLDKRIAREAAKAEKRMAAEQVATKEEAYKNVATETAGREKS